MADEPLNAPGLVAPRRRSWTKMERLRLTLGQQTFDWIQQQVWNDYIAAHKPPYTPGSGSRFSRPYERQ